jgi:hypothetical protein
MDVGTLTNVKFALGSALVAELITAGASSNLTYADVDQDELVDAPTRTRSNSVVYSAQFASAEVSDSQAETAALRLASASVSYVDSTGTVKTASITAMASSPVTPTPSSDSSTEELSAGVIAAIVLSVVAVLAAAIGLKLRQKSRRTGVEAMEHDHLVTKAKR